MYYIHGDTGPRGERNRRISIERSVFWEKFAEARGKPPRWFDVDAGDLISDESRSVSSDRMDFECIKDGGNIGDGIIFGRAISRTKILPLQSNGANSPSQYRVRGLSENYLGFRALEFRPLNPVSVGLRIRGQLECHFLVRNSLPVNLKSSVNCVVVSGGRGAALHPPCETFPPFLFPFFSFSSPSSCLLVFLAAFRGMNNEARTNLLSKLFSRRLPIIYAAANQVPN